MHEMKLFLAFAVLGIALLGSLFLPEQRYFVKTGNAYMDEAVHFARVIAQSPRGNFCYRFLNALSHTSEDTRQHIDEARITLLASESAQVGSQGKFDYMSPNIITYSKEKQVLLQVTVCLLYELAHWKWYMWWYRALKQEHLMYCFYAAAPHNVTWWIFRVVLKKG
jgi:hypothetical protein